MLNTIRRRSGAHCGEVSGMTLDVFESWDRGVPLPGMRRGMVKVTELDFAYVTLDGKSWKDGGQKWHMRSYSESDERSIR